jgi:hypothetical protein
VDAAATSLQLALDCGHRWLAMLESGEVKSLWEIAECEKIDNSYVNRTVVCSPLLTRKRAVFNIRTYDQT